MTNHAKTRRRHPYLRVDHHRPPAGYESQEQRARFASALVGVMFDMWDPRVPKDQVAFRAHAAAAILDPEIPKERAVYILEAISAGILEKAQQHKGAKS